MATVALSKLGKRFGALTALESLDLAIEDGEFLVLLGPSGCGKTTTMRMIAGLERPTSGDILIDGVRVNDVHARDRDLAMVFQNYALYPHMTVGENIGYPLKVRGMGREERTRRVEAAARQVASHRVIELGLRQIGGNDIISTTSEVTDADGALVCTTGATLVHRGAAEGSDA